MNKVHLVGRLGKDPELKSTNSGTTFCRFSIGINRGKRKGQDLGTDWPNCVAWGSTAEFLVKYGRKGKMIGVNGSIHTGSYDKDGQKVYTTEVWADQYDGIELLSPKDEAAGNESQYAAEEQPMQTDPETGYAVVNDDQIPF